MVCGVMFGALWNVHLAREGFESSRPLLYA